MTKKNSEMLEAEVIILSIKDFFTKPMLKIALLPLVFTLIIMLVMFYTAAGFGFDSLQIYIEQTQNGQNVMIDEEAPFYFIWITSLMAFLFKYSITSWLVGFLVYTIGTIFIMMFSVFLTVIIIGFLTPTILNVLHKRHYSHIQINGFGSFLSPVLIAVKSFIVMVLLFVLFIPLYFIPFINLLAINLPFYYFFHKMLNYDVASTLLTEQEYRYIHSKKANTFRFRTLLLYFLSMIPSLMLFSAVFFIIYLGHGYFIELEKLKKVEDKNKLIEQDL
ncbi:EI24 domain-containing protein [Halarcobacter anaerophilus]|uniref:EI24 domain-containing protein n=1 Tax=Halarcobacter anaerophilus TaxID=877500 RepID=UPI000AA064F4|nr:EI24 domain-containing protein [Halarcobacter anaerophilus]